MVKNYDRGVTILASRNKDWGSKFNVREGIILLFFNSSRVLQKKSLFYNDQGSLFYVDHFTSLHRLSKDNTGEIQMILVDNHTLGMRKDSRYMYMQNACVQGKVVGIGD